MQAGGEAHMEDWQCSPIPPYSGLEPAQQARPHPPHLGQVDMPPETISRPKRAEIGDVVAGKYRLLEKIGEGGMGVVYLAEHTLIEKRLALKVLRPEYSDRPELVSRFQQEAISASRIKHPNVLDVFDFGQLEDGSFFLAMEHLSGRDLAAELTQCRTIVPGRAVRLALQMCRALAAAHARGVVHRDLKPENVFLTVTEDGDEIVKIVDFGIAQLKSNEESHDDASRPRRLTRTGMIFGTPEYMSPEQAKGASIDLRSDIYSLGIILYEMVSGAVPFSGTTFMAVLTAHLTHPIPPLRAIAPDLTISCELERAILRCLEKDREKRFQSMRDLAAALQSAEEGRIASPLAGLVPMPEVTAGSFRPARGTAAATAPEFGRLDPLPFELVARQPQRDHLPTDAATPTHKSDSGEQSVAAAETAGTPASPTSHPGTWPRTAMFLIALLATGGATLAWRHYGDRTRKYLADRAWIRDKTPESRVGAGAHERTATASDLPSAVASAFAPGMPQVVSAGPQPKDKDAAIDGAPQSSLSASDPSKIVLLTVQSNLAGATVTKDGFQVCDQTPCTVEVPRGAAVELVGTKGFAHGVARVLAQQNQTVNIALSFSKKDGKTKDSNKPGLCEVTVDGLKILRPCQQSR
jgi:serine/threonine protein kinase